MITKKQYEKALTVIKQYREQLNKPAVIGTFKISFDDVERSWNGFSVPKITQMSDEKLMELQDKLFEIGTCNYTNIEEYSYLTVGWEHKYTMTDDEVKRVVEILNCLCAVIGRPSFE